MQSKRSIFYLARFGVPGLLALAVATLLFGNIGASAQQAALTRAPGTRMQDGYVAHPIQVKPVTKKLGKAQSVRLKTSRGAGTSIVLFPCQSDTDPEPILCYGPGQIAHAYGVQDLVQHRITGQGSTIVIIDAFGSPTIQADLQAFDADWGLPAPTFTVLTPFGISGADSGWAVETSLDVEWSHVMAPGAAIDLVVAASNSDVDLYNAIKYAVDQNLGDIISLNFGENEACMDPNLLATEHQVFQEAASKGISVLASSGDFGSAQFTCDDSSFITAVSYPASDPLVTVLGGTALTADASTGQYIGETAWNESADFGASSGGGYSVLFPRPSYQQGDTGATSGRAVPDLALNASVDGGVLVYQTDPLSGQEFVSIEGGTSVGAPEFAGIVADGVQLAQHRLGFLNSALFRLGASPLAERAFQDITSGNNILFLSGVAGYTVQRGWDAVTGWGSPRAADLLPLLIAHEQADDAQGL